MATDAPSPPAAVERATALLDEHHAAAGRMRSEGYLDLLGRAAPASPGAAQDVMLSGALPVVYERWWRPAWGRLAKGVRGPSMEDEHRIASELLAIHEGDAVLDVACGTGNFTRRFARAAGTGGLTVGIDLSETMLARAVADTRAAGLAEQTAYVRGDAERLPFADATFDAVCCFAALNLMSDPMTSIESMARVLAPGGRIALFTSARMRSPWLRFTQEMAVLPAGMRLFGVDELTGALERLGFTEVRRLATGWTQFVGGVLPSR
jgi:ubiquinone/menaquinone biosynthesis C-methylase UbiE